MTTAQEEVVLMDCLRNHVRIGCGSVDGRPGHLPELCGEERSEYWIWETELRGLGDAGEDAYQFIREIAKVEWQQRYGEPWVRSPLLEARTHEMLKITTGTKTNRVGTP